MKFKSAMKHPACGVIVLIALALIPGLAQAKTETFKLKDSTVQFTLPSGWVSKQNLFNIPLTLLSPMQGNQRSVISVIPTPGAAIKFEEDRLEEEEWQYRMARKDFIEQQGGEITKFTSYQTRKLASGDKAHVVGYNAKIEGAEFIETSYYLNCKDKFYVLTATVRDAKEVDNVDKVARTFSCQ